jgi:hypothetical protein
LINTVVFTEDLLNCRLVEPRQPERQINAAFRGVAALNPLDGAGCGIDGSANLTQR